MIFFRFSVKYRKTNRPLPPFPAAELITSEYILRAGKWSLSFPFPLLFQSLKLSMLKNCSKAGSTFRKLKSFRRCRLHFFRRDTSLPLSGKSTRPLRRATAFLLAQAQVLTEQRFRLTSPTAERASLKPADARTLWKDSFLTAFQERLPLSFSVMKSPLRMKHIPR